MRFSLRMAPVSHDILRSYIVVDELHPYFGCARAMRKSAALVGGVSPNDYFRYVQFQHAARRESLTFRAVCWSTILNAASLLPQQANRPRTWTAKQRKVAYSAVTVIMAFNRF